jgi:hypothetical protein
MTLRNTALATVLLAATLGAGCASPQPIYDTEIKISDKHMHYRISKTEGEKMLIELAKTAKREDAWIYRMRDGQGEWIDIGKRFEMGPFGGSVEWDTRYLDYVLKKGDEITDYHIHPVTEADPIIDTINEMLHTPSPSDWRIESWLPSSCDFISNYYTKRKLTKKGVKMNPSRVISSHAITIYDTDVSKKINESLLTSVINKYTKQSGRQGLEDLKRLKTELRQYRILLETIILNNTEK